MFVSAENVQAISAAYRFLKLMISNLEVTQQRYSSMQVLVIHPTVLDPGQKVSRQIAQVPAANAIESATLS
jgi:hypothetical protein